MVDIDETNLELEDLKVQLRPFSTIIDPRVVSIEKITDLRIQRCLS